MTNLNHLLNQVLTSQDELKEKQVEATDRNGVITAVVTCNKQLVDLRIDRGSSVDLHSLKGCIIDATNLALKKADAAVKQEMIHMTKGLIDLNIGEGGYK